MKTCQTQDLCREFLDAVERVVQDLRAKNLTRPTDAEGYCEMAQNCGPIGWALLHGAATAFLEHVCEKCGQDAESLVRAMHDLVNTKLGKPLHAAVDVRRWEPVMRQAILTAEAQLPEGDVVQLPSLGWGRENATSGPRSPHPVASHHQENDVASVARALPWSAARESVWALLMLPDGKVLPHQVASGQQGNAPVPADRLFEIAKDHGARELVLVHNHPSGSRSPSAEDLATTGQVTRLAESQGLTLRDHLIVAGHDVVSIMAAKKPAVVCDCPLNLRVAQVSAAERERRRELGRQLQLSLFGEAEVEVPVGGAPTAPDYDYRTIPALIRNVSLETAQQLARLSNASIKEYKPSELARVFRVEAEAGLTPEQIGKMYGSRRPGEVQQYLDISLLPLDLQELLDVAGAGKSYTVAHAAVLGRAMRVYQIGPNTVRQIFTRVLQEREYTASQLEKLVATFGPQLREVQGELFPGEEFTGSLTGILGLIRKAMDGIRDLSRKRRLLNCVSRMVREKEEAGERVSAELRRSQEEAQEEIEQLDGEIEAVRDRLGIAIKKQPAGPPVPAGEPEPEPVVIPKEQMALVSDPQAGADTLRRIADGLERRAGLSGNSPALLPQARSSRLAVPGVASGPAPQAMAAQNREIGYALCETPDGRTVHGPVAYGDHDHVDIPMTCPAGSKPYGTFHSHPDGEAKPSPADEREACRLGLKLLCVSDGHHKGANVNCSKPRC